MEDEVNRMDIKRYIRKSIEFDKRKLRQYRAIAGKNPGIELRCRIRKSTGKREYYYRDPISGHEHYLGLKDCKMIMSLQEKEIYTKLIDIIFRNIKVKERFYEELLSEDIEGIRKTLPPAFHHDPAIEKALKDRGGVKQSENPFHKEELKIKTSFGLFVRTKGEMAIAELLYSLGIEFYYEKGIKLKVTRQDDFGHIYKKVITRYPDFTIVLADGRNMYWEHKGLLSNKDYIERDIQREIDYNTNGIYQSHNLIVTAEGPNNEMDMDGIRNIVECMIMPLL